MNLNDRISKVIEYSGLSSSEFADEIEVQRSSVSHITSGRNKPSLDFVLKIKDRFPELEWNWLLKNEGSMLSTTSEESSKIEDKPNIPDLFSHLDEADFLSHEKLPLQSVINKPSESDKTFPNPKKENISDSQRLENNLCQNDIQTSDNQSIKIKRIVLFYENGKFESFEP